MFAAVLFLVAALACASHTDESTPAPNPMFKRLFRTLKTGALEMYEWSDASCLLNYTFRLTEESISRFRGLLFDESIDASQHGSENVVLDSNGALAVGCEVRKRMRAGTSLRGKAATGLQDSLVRIMKGELNKEEDALRKYQKESLSVVLLRYAFFKVWLHKGLDPAESKMLEDIFSGDTGTCRFVRRLIHAEDHSGLLAAFADGWESKAVTLIMHSLNAENPHVITELVEEHVEKHESIVGIPLDLFKELAVECRYRLAMKLADLEPYYEGINWYTFYILSRFSKHPSEKIRALCLENNTTLSVHEGQKVHGSGRQSTDMKAFNPYVLPKEVWLEILLYLDELTHIYVAWRVCDMWRKLGCNILHQSPAVQAAWKRDLSDPIKSNRFVYNDCYPWNHLFGSQSASLKCMASRLNNGAQDSPEIYSGIREVWSLVCGDINRGSIRMLHESYLDLYSRCCKAIKLPLDFPPLLGMSVEEYVALAESLVSNHGIIPFIADVFLEEHCEMFVGALEKHGDLIVKLFKDDPNNYSRLVTNLFLTKSFIPPKIAGTLAAKSSLYGLLLNRRNGGEECFDIVPRDFTDSWCTYTPIHSVIDLCLFLGPEGDSRRLRLMEEAVIGHFCGQNANEETKYQKLKELGANVLKFLRKNRKSYSAEELGTIERVLDKFRTYGRADDPVTPNYEPVWFLKDPQFVIRWSANPAQDTM